MNKTMACEDCEAIDEAFGKMGEMQKKIAIKKITEMEESLERTGFILIFSVGLKQTV